MTKVSTLAMAACLAALFGAPSQAAPVMMPSAADAITLVRDGCGPGYRMGDYGDCRPQRYRSRDYDVGGGYNLHYECPRGFRYSERSGRCRPFRPY